MKKDKSRPFLHRSLAGYHMLSYVGDATKETETVQPLYVLLN
jgi:hypothetical protein